MSSIVIIMSYYSGRRYIGSSFWWLELLDDEMIKSTPLRNVTSNWFDSIHSNNLTVWPSVLCFSFKSRKLCCCYLACCLLFLYLPPCITFDISFISFVARFLIFFCKNGLREWNYHQFVVVSSNSSSNSSSERNVLLILQWLLFWDYLNFLFIIRR